MSAEAAAGGPLLVGVGSPDRGDDAVGPAVARAVAGRATGVLVVAHEDPTSLLDLWAGHEPVVVVDAVRGGGRPGTVHVVETGAGSPPLPGPSSGRAGAGTHALGVGDVVELARALGRLPRRLVLVGVEGARFDPGAALSGAVAAAVEEAAERAVAVLCGRGGDRDEALGRQDGLCW